MKPFNVAVAHPDELSVGSSGADRLEALFSDLEEPLLGYALRIVEIRSTAEDLVQEAFLRLQANWEAVEHPRKWLYATVHRLALNYLRDNGKLVSLEDGGQADCDWTDPQPLPDEKIAHCESIGLVRLSMENLKVRERELIRLKFHEELTYREMSARTGLTVGHVGLLLHRALKMIAAEVARSGGKP